MPTRAEIVACARTYLQTPFQHQGRIRGRAVDCVGLPLCVARDLGVRGLWEEESSLNYAPYPADDTVLRRLQKYLTAIPVEAIREGDIICLRQPVPCHVAIVSWLPPNLGMIHAYNVPMRVVEHDIDAYWRERIAGAFRFPEVGE